MLASRHVRNSNLEILVQFPKMNVGLNVMKTLKSHIFPRCTKILTKAFSDKYLLYTNVGISISLSCLGDVLEQHYEILTHQITGWDSVRTRNMSFSGASVGVLCHYWYRFLDRHLPGYTLRIVLKKIVVDQFIGSPLSISTFFVTVACLEGATMDQFVTEVKQKAWKLYVAEWMIWPPAQFINFYILPTKYRVLFDNTISLGYDVYTSHVKHNHSSKNDNSDESS